ncbi:MAG: tRNA lysidine(34) synthetase TilS, partial [Calditrichaeota bacterium]|nr:tRNA lysidine(34) synthetase TilS [Calditrichota bacterium]
KHFCKTCDDENIARNSDLVLAAFSGGADSVALLDLLHRIHDERGGFQLAACHYNHKLRDEADGDQRQVEEFCQKRNIKLIISSGDVAAEADRRGISIHAAARQLRYCFLVKAVVSLLEENDDKGSAYIFTGHHYDDQIETVLMRLFNGSGVEGLSGIRQRLILSEYKQTSTETKITLFRPLLNVSRTEIEEYCESRKLPVITDQSNFDTRYPRNLIRHELLPVIRNVFGDAALTGITRSAELADLTSELLQQELKTAFADTLIKKGSNEITLDYHKFSAYLTILRLSILRYSAQLLIKTDHRITYERIQTAERSLSTGSKGPIELGSDIRISRSGDKIFIYRNNENGWEAQQIKPGESIRIPGFGQIVTSILNMDDCQLPPPYDMQYCDWGMMNTERFTIRPAEKGDRITPYGMTGTHKVSDILRENNIPSHRRKWPIVCIENTIIAVPPFRIAEQFKLSNATQEVIAFRFTAQVT